MLFVIYIQPARGVAILTPHPKRRASVLLFLVSARSRTRGRHAPSRPSPPGVAGMFGPRHTLKRLQFSRILRATGFRIRTFGSGTDCYTAASVPFGFAQGSLGCGA